MREHIFELPDRLPAADISDIGPEAFLQRYPAAEFTRRVVELRRGRRGWTWPLAGLAAAGAAAALVLALVGGPQQERHDAFGGKGTLGFKGTDQPIAPPERQDVQFRMHVQKGGGSVPARAGEPLRPFSRVRFTYTAGEAGYLMVVSLNQDGELTYLYPGDEGPSIPIAPGAKIPLQGAVELDDYVGMERFYAIFTPRPIPATEVNQAVKEALHARTGPGSEEWLSSLERLPLEHPQRSIWIVKTSIGTREADVR